MRAERQETKRRNRSILLPALRGLRQSAGLSQREFAKKAGVSQGTVYRLENGHRGAYPVTVRKLARALEVDIRDLVREDRPDTW